MKPINKNAAMAISGGYSFNPNRRVTQVESDNPLKTTGTISAHWDLTGMRAGRLTVVGKQPKIGKRGGGKWVCRCDCGRYVVRKAKSIKENIGGMRCDECDYLRGMKSKAHFLKTGVYLPNHHFNTD